MKLLMPATLIAYDVRVTETVTRTYTKRFEAVSAREAKDAANDELDAIEDDVDLRDEDWREWSGETVDTREVYNVVEVPQRKGA